MFRWQPYPTDDLLPKGYPRNTITGLLFCAVLAATAQEVRFTVLRGDDPVGNIRASRSVSEERTFHSITSSTELWVLWKQEVQTSMSAEYSDGHLSSSHYTLVVNGKMRDSSRMSSTSTGRWAYVHPSPSFPYRSVNQWTTSRMYFEEPVGQSSILVESVLRDCPIRSIGPGIYELTLPNNDRNRYIYTGGRLMKVQADRLLLSLVFRRT